MRKVDQTDLEALREKIQSLTGILTVYEESPEVMSKPYLKLTFTGTTWVRDGLKICIHFRAFLTAKGKGMRFLENVINAQADFTANILTNPLTEEYSDTVMHRINSTAKEQFLIYDNKNKTPIEIIDDEYIYSRPYEIEYQLTI